MIFCVISQHTEPSPMLVSDSSSTGIATLNSLRYRGYYYDKDLDLYYLQSRYYDAEIGRFINADGTLNGNGDIMGFNMFAYCSNNPVMFSDPSGNSVVEWLRNKWNSFKERLKGGENEKINQPSEKASVAFSNTLLNVREGTKENGEKFVTVDVQIDLTNENNILNNDETKEWSKLVYDETIEMTKDTENLWLMDESHLIWEYKAHKSTVSMFENSEIAHLNVEETPATLVKRGIEVIFKWGE